MTLNSLQQNQLTLNHQPLVIGELSIRQDEDGRYCINDLHKASGGADKHQPAFFMRNKQTKDLIEEIVNSANLQSLENSQIEPTKKIEGVKGGTFVVKELVYYYAMWISAKFHLTVIRAYDAMVMRWQINDRQSISPEQQALLHEIVNRRSQGNRKIYAEMWSRHNRHFKIPRYAELLVIHFSDSVHYLETIQIKQQIPLLPVPFQKGRFLVVCDGEQLTIHDVADYQCIKKDAMQKFQEDWQKAYREMVGIATDLFIGGSNIQRQDEKLPVLSKLSRF